MRNFGIKLSRRTAFDGGTNPQPGALSAHDTQRTNLIRFPRPVSSLGSAANSRAQQREPFIDLREFATSVFLVGFCALVVILVALGRAAYLTLVP